jgi:hypothetical protein
MAMLALIGTLPQDPDGSQRLTAILESLRPEAIAVEDHAAILQPTAQARAAADGALIAIRQVVDDPLQLEFWRHRLSPEQVHFQAFACAAYGSAWGVPVHFLGDPDAESDSVGDATALAQLDADTLRGMAAFDWQTAYANDYARARRELEAKGCIEFLVPVDQHRAFWERDRVLAVQIERLLADNERLAVVCAVPHLYFSDTGLTVYMQVGDASAQRYLSDGRGEVRDFAIAHPH